VVFRGVRISIRGLVRWLVGWLVGWSVGDAFLKIDEKWAFTDQDSSDRGKKSEDEEGGTMRMEGRGGRRDEESEKMKNLLKRMKNEKGA